MRNFLSLALSAFIFFTAAIPASAQWQRAITPNDTLQPIRWNPDGSATFSIYAPKARQVSISGDIQARGVTPKEVNGVWSFTIPNVAPGIYRYSYVVDGIKVYDPKSPLAGETTALATIGGDEFFSFRDNVPHGAVSQRYYYSETLKGMRRMHVWTPAGFETMKGNKKLPVLYLIHGGGDNDNSWPTVGAAGQILDNLLAEGKIEPMIVVMPNGTITDVPDEVPPFAEDMIKSIIPFVESNYPVYTDKDHRAVAGLSMGGMESMEVAFNNIDKFSYVWVLSSSFQPSRKPADEAARLGIKANAEKINKSFKQLVFTEGGSADIAYQNFQNTRKELDAAGLKYEYMENAQSGHTWSTWRNDLYVLAQRIFK